MAVASLKDYECPVCLDVMKDPMELPCSHVLCQTCLDGIITHHKSNDETDSQVRCPVCKQAFTLQATRKARQIQTDIRHKSAKCPTCSQQIPLFKMKQHQSYCQDLDSYVQRPSIETGTRPKTNTRQQRQEPNRVTFQCPYCYEANFDNTDLIDHVKDFHEGNKQKVVCPICASMPWGNSDQVSADFQEHLNMRHKFQYDMFVPFGESEDEQLAYAMHQSLLG